ncbi:uncharacterized protein LOC135924554 isoform X1 [Gordionus sp. m RMFG-2023]|uniref:uncharacterized protein LOC135924554 isoform X1 n=2 Tax=Gordionus sp. m RMFG-2023 TaxID=3053472 RepID=UPI0031FC524D
MVNNKCLFFKLFIVYILMLQVKSQNVDFWAGSGSGIPPNLTNQSYSTSQNFLNITFRKYQRRKYLNEALYVPKISKYKTYNTGLSYQPHNAYFLSPAIMDEWFDPIVFNGPQLPHLLETNIKPALASFSTRPSFDNPLPFYLNYRNNHILFYPLYQVGDVTYLSSQPTLIRKDEFFKNFDVITRVRYFDTPDISISVQEFSGSGNI